MSTSKGHPYRGQKAADTSGRSGGHPSVVRYTKRRGSTPGSGNLTTTLASKSEAVETVSIISRDPPQPQYHTLQVVETGFGGLIGPKGTRPKSVFVSGSLYAANGPLTIEGFTHGDSFSTDGPIHQDLQSRQCPNQNPTMMQKSFGAVGHSSAVGPIGTSSPLPLQSTEDLHSRCGSRQSLLESNSRRDSRVFYVPAVPAATTPHQYTNVGCTASDNQLQHPQSQVSDRFQKASPQTSVVKSNHRPNSKSDVDNMRKQREAIKKDLQKKMDLRWDRDTYDRSRCNWSFVFDPAGRLCYYWSMIVSLAFLYNFWVIIFRFSFAEITWDTLVIWFSLDYFMDVIYILDIVFHFRTGYLEDGVLQVDSTKLRLHYMNSTTFYVDCLCLLPLDFLYLSLGFKSILRIFRLVKVYQFWAFMDRSERHTNYPNVLRFVSLIHYLLLVFHWNACLFHLLYIGGFGLPNLSGWGPDVFPVEGDSVLTYLMSLHWTILALTTIGDLAQPKNRYEYLYVIFELIVGLITFATVLGIIANIVTNVSAARKDFQAKLDGVKTYMRMRRVPNNIQNKVIKWFDYLWLTQKSSDEEKAVSCLPDKLKGEIAIHVHLDTLKRVEIFQNTEAGFLCELVLRLRPVLFSPGDYICRKGEVGKEMYICARGRLEVVVDNGKTVLATLKAGSYFGEISILNMGAAGNRRTASVRSVGYSDLFVLSKKDMWEVLKDYPAARVRLEAIAGKRLEKYKKAPLEKAALPRSTSTPGLVESIGKIPLEDMWVSPLPLYTNETSPDSTSKARRHTESPTSEALSSRSESTIDKDSNGAIANPTFSASLMTSPNKNQQYSFYNQPPATLTIEGSATHQCSRGSYFAAKSILGNNASQSQCPPQPKPRIPHHPLTVLQVSNQNSSLFSQEHPLDDVQQTRVSNKEDLLHEIQRLRERIRGLESDNAALHLKMSRAQKDVDQRLTEIELQIGPDDDDDDDDSSSPSGGNGNHGNGMNESGNSAEEEADNNKESFI